MWGCPNVAGLLLAAAGVQLRLQCNLFDGMVAIEGGKHSPVGALYNEFPAQLADSLLLVALGHACQQPWLGWLAALTAYIRQTGTGLGFGHDFRGPMAKQQRMFVLTAAAVVGAIESTCGETRYALLSTCAVIALGAGDLRHPQPRAGRATARARVVIDTLLVASTKALIGAYPRWLDDHP